MFDMRSFLHNYDAVLKKVFVRGFLAVRFRIPYEELSQALCRILHSACFFVIPRLYASRTAD